MGKNNLAMNQKNGRGVVKLLKVSGASLKKKKRGNISDPTRPSHTDQQHYVQNTSYLGCQMRNLSCHGSLKPII